MTFFSTVRPRRWYSARCSLVITLALMGVATFLIGLLPTFEQAGYLAPLCLVILRLVQGVASGGEWGGGVLMLSENAPPKRAGFYAAWSQLGVSGGFVLSAAVFYLVQQLPGDDFMRWGWRLPFLASVAIFGVGLYIRRKLPESRDFTQANVARDTALHLPALQVLREPPREVLQAMGLRLAENGGAYIFLSFSMAYAKFSGLSTQLVLFGALTMLMLLTVCGPSHAQGSVGAVAESD
ncbi:MFS transporter [Pseudomonas chlororaphis]|uniref:MFS transporter n=1 Tax=Pseudomonas chlororaphis TaxID=587753 RepID=UPI00209AC9C3|nr:MFS transporter [Pseudomonas chlororaphis]